MRTPTHTHLVTIALVGSSLFASPACNLDLRPLSSSIDAELEDAVSRGFDGIIVYVDQPGGPSLHSAGWKDRDAQVPADPGSLFKIASISKLYMAAATATLVADGQLDLDSNLADLLPEVGGHIENANEITLRMMLRHRSGIPEYIYRSDFTNQPDDTYMETASLVYGEPADFPPDARYRYSNTNFLLLGEILDRTLGYSHHDYISNVILRPLDLHDTYNLFSEVDPDDVMSGYHVGYDPDLKLLEDHTRPGGSMVATAADVGVFVRALVDGSLLSKKEQEIYTSIYPYEHTGWVGGYTSIVRYHPDTDAVVVQFVNTSRGPLYWTELERVYGRVVKIVEREALR